jgi:hypothetical protein
MGKETQAHKAPHNPTLALCVGVTGHRQANAAFRQNRAAIEQALGEMFALLEAKAKDILDETNKAPPIKLHSLMVEGVDQISANLALSRGWTLVAPLPFGRALNTAINANPDAIDDARALLSGTPLKDAPCTERAQQIGDLLDQATCFELADQDAIITQLYLDKLAHPTDMAKAQAFSFAASERVALAGQIMVEQSDVIVGVWDGVSTSFTGGTGHTIALALASGTPVVWINAHAPSQWRVLTMAEDLLHLGQEADDLANETDRLTHVIANALRLETMHKTHGTSKHMEGMAALTTQKWHRRSSLIWHAYRRVEALFGASNLAGRFKSLRQTYEDKDTIVTGSGASLLAEAKALPGADAPFVAAIASHILSRFAWADGVSARLSDAFRSGMVYNFIFSALAIIGGIAYLPFASSEQKWMFALFELVLLCAILGITFWGLKQRWHGRWFETRRVAEYLRLAPILMLLGVARPTSRWPKGSHTSWPEFYVRHIVRGLGLPSVAITGPYLRAVLSNILVPFVQDQNQYHRGKAKRLAKAHHRLDSLSELSFKLAIASVSSYLLLKLGVVAHVVPHDVTANLSKLFTFLGVVFPTLGGAAAGIRYFGDFERFSAISDVTAQKLAGIEDRIDILLKAPVDNLTYGHVAALAHATDDIVISEIESWQAVFSGKQISVPV